MRAVREGDPLAHPSALREAAAEREALVAELHRDVGAAGKPWTVSAAMEIAGQAWFRVTVLGVELGVRLSELLFAGARLVPGPFRIGPTDRWGVQVATLDDLLSPGSRRDTERIAVTFFSPTTFRSADGRSHDPEPTPERLLGSWRRRWIGHLGRESLVPATAMIAPAPGADDTLLDWVRGCVTLEHDTLERRDVQPAGGRGAPIPTVRGTMHLAIHSPACPERDAFRALVRLGGYAGTGRHLNVGFGQTLTTIAAPPILVRDPVGSLLAVHRFG
jgi:hypothetical protein